MSVVPFVLLTLWYCVGYGEGHVALVFPPARKYDLDFLDSSRTKAPCGMPKGKQRSNRPQGQWLRSRFNPLKLRRK